MGRKSNASERRDQIIWALYDCLSEKGHEKVTIKVIAGQAKLAPGVIHYYFQSKDEIISSLAEAIIEQYSKALDSRVAEAESTEQQIEYTIDFIVDLIFNRSLARVFYNLIQMTFGRKFLENVMKKMFNDYRQQCANIFKEAGPRAFKRDDVRQIISAAVKNLSKAV
jgi:AcrR family transcriptional regulator